MNSYHIPANSSLKTYKVIMSQWLTYPVMSIPTKHTEPSKKNMQPTSVEFMPAASLAWGPNMNSMKPTPQKFTVLSRYGKPIEGL